MVKRILLRLLLFAGLVVGVLIVNYLLFNLTATRITKGLPIENSDPANVALLVIDIQEGITGSVSVAQDYKDQAGPFIGVVNRVIEDAYEKGQLLIYIRSEISNPLLNVLNNTLAKGSPGADLDKRLLIKPGHVITKRKSDSFTNPELDRILAENQIGKVVLVGLDAGHCVKSTLLAAKNRGYEITAIEDAILSKDPAQKREILDEYRELGVEIASMH